MVVCRERLFALNSCDFSAICSLISLLLREEGDAEQRWGRVWCCCDIAADFDAFWWDFTSLILFTGRRRTKSVRVGSFWLLLYAFGLEWVVWNCMYLLGIICCCCGLGIYLIWSGL
ncbi:hypothetical protein R3W88_009026 [Solanum pinnatisectum]|uniref:Uncharacterized protein n=1 Tax=Solanum pinnatisectum TaxID=50273 RepID=A0AAV9MD46_9SOLN|nr:hypothetical protein R3W88_009026 [Solanum pinnatisectum]